MPKYDECSIYSNECYTNRCEHKKAKVMTHRPIAEIKAELAAAIEAERLEKERLAVKAKYVFTILPNTDPYYKVYDESCSLFVLSGKVANADELIQAKKIVPSEGSMRYLFNTVTKQIVMAVSGGVSFTNNPDCFAAINLFLTKNPNGGDITPIMNYFIEVDAKERGRKNSLILGE